VLLLTVYPATRLTAQTDPRLVDALRLAQNGQVDSARGVIRRLLATLSPTDSVYPQALLAAAKIAPDAATVATNLNRIVLEYGASPWADDAARRGADHPGGRAAAARLPRLAAPLPRRVPGGACLLRAQE